MKIKERYQSKKPIISFEVFPPKKEDEFDAAYSTLDELSILNPDFISVTYGAGGSRSKKTIEIASYIQNQLQIEALAHITCVGFKSDDLMDIYEDLKRANVTHVLALRGDRPMAMSEEQFMGREFFYAADMISFLKKNTNLNVAGACYPEKHYEAVDFKADLIHLKEKADLGLDFLVSQLFFDNTCFYRFREASDKLGIHLPVSAGIMPITSAKMLGNTVALSGSSVPKELSDIIANYGEHPDDMRKAGIDYAIRQCQDLKKNGVDGLHIYTMNKSKTASQIVNAL